MLFTTPEFFIFLIVVLIGIELIRKQLWQHLFLLAASYFFYWWSGSIHILLLVFVTLASFYCGYKLFKAQTKKNKRVWLIIGTIIPLAVLAYFKYIDFGIYTINYLFGTIGINVSIGLLNIALPVGISFFTFQALSYVFDIYLGKLEPEQKLYKYALFIAFFPALVAGPIVRASEFLPQLKNKIRITGSNLQAGVTLIIWGLFKKMVIADNIAPIVNGVFANPSASSSIWIIAATVLFGIQIYCDFSGYAHIAIGCARIFGFTIPENFNLPFLSHNIQDFWNRWHMTLSRFIRDYIYYPLNYSLSKFNRHHIKERRIRTKANEISIYICLILSMTLCGLWHGASWTFVLFGVYNGVLLAVYTYLIRFKKVGVNCKFLSSNPGVFLKIIFFQIQFIIGNMIFRSNNLETLSECIQKVILFDFQFSTAMILAIIICLAGLVTIFVLMFSKRFASAIHNLCYFDYLGLISKLKVRYWCVFIAVFCLIIFILSPVDTPEFIYFAF